ncbi:E3 ubiquitin-protein ligase FANCL [Danaus plexippus]|uniref:E3 ubiquitin-protein ligase FANCL n=1 Tax=Danaus plexippus TaxID=13037 RepID=UPI002AB0AF3A|nr:E3 ubiquitin-protein ligase FANCL [Danaus plexippus]
MDKEVNIHDLMHTEEAKTISGFFAILEVFFNQKPCHSLETINSDFIDKDLIKEIKSLSNTIPIYFGKTVRDIKCTISDEHNLRKHDIYLKYKGVKKLAVVAVNLPHSHLQDREYSSIEEVVSAFQNYVNSLAEYFRELENIDLMCNVREPVKPTFKDDYRRILVDNKTWLHIEVSFDGRPRNVHIIGNSEIGQDKTKNFLLNWDHDKNIVENIHSLFGELTKNGDNWDTELIEVKADEEVTSCCICFCVELPDCPGIPQPMCQNSKCGAYYHRSCLFQWLVACDGGRIPAFGVASGNCPSCFQHTTCREKDNY